VTVSFRYKQKDGEYIVEFAAVGWKVIVFFKCLVALFVY